MPLMLRSSWDAATEPLTYRPKFFSPSLLGDGCDLLIFLQRVFPSVLYPPERCCECFESYLQSKKNISSREYTMDNPIMNSIVLLSCIWIDMENPINGSGADHNI